MSRRRYDIHGECLLKGGRRDFYRWEKIVYTFALLRKGQEGNDGYDAWQLRVGVSSEKQGRMSSVFPGLRYGGPLILIRGQNGLALEMASTIIH